MELCSKAERKGEGEALKEALMGQGVAGVCVERAQAQGRSSGVEKSWRLGLVPGGQKGGGRISCLVDGTKGII